MVLINCTEILSLGKALSFNITISPRVLNLSIDRLSLIIRYKELFWHLLY